MWFDATLRDADGNTVAMYSVVTPVETVTQTYAEGAPPMTLPPGTRCRVVGAANGNTELLWIEIDEVGEFCGANALIPTTNLRIWQPQPSGEAKS